jgi:two-component system sensor histidine kinase KdpD
LLRHNRATGVLGVKVAAQATLAPTQRDLLEAFASQLAMVVEREYLRAASEREKLLASSAKLHRTLLESVSHELRTPLAVINTALENLAEADPVLRANLIAESRTAAARLNRLVGNLLDQTRLESGALKPRLDWCDAEDLINSAVEITGDALLSHPLEIHVSDGLPLLRADFALTEQVLVNLLLNVVRHTPPATPLTISAGRETGGQRIYFTVADHGPGFDPSLRERLFRKFARGDNARVGGLGLGLSIVRGFITAQGGEVTAGENSGGGAIITLYLPHTEPENSSPE